MTAGAALTKSVALIHGGFLRDDMTVFFKPKCLQGRRRVFAHKMPTLPISPAQRMALYKGLRISSMAQERFGYKVIWYRRSAFRLVLEDTAQAHDLEVEIGETRSLLFSRYDVAVRGNLNDIRSLMITLRRWPNIQGTIHVVS